MTDNERARAIIEWFNPDFFDREQIANRIAAALAEVRAEERERCAELAGQLSGFVSCEDSFARGYDAGRTDAAAAIRASKDDGNG